MRGHRLDAPPCGEGYEKGSSLSVDRVDRRSRYRHRPAGRPTTIRRRRSTISVHAPCPRPLTPRRISAAFPPRRSVDTAVPARCLSPATAPPRTAFARSGPARWTGGSTTPTGWPFTAAAPSRWSRRPATTARPAASPRRRPSAQFPADPRPGLPLSPWLSLSPLDGRPVPAGGLLLQLLLLQRLLAPGPGRAAYVRVVGDGGFLRVKPQGQLLTQNAMRNPSVPWRPFKALLSRLRLKPTSL